MRKYTTLTASLRDILNDNFPKEAKFVAISGNTLTWDDSDWEYNMGMKRHDYVSESEFIKFCEMKNLIKNKSKDMNLATELKRLSEAYVSPKIEELQIKLKVAAKKGERHLTVKASETDNYTSKWLKAQGLTVNSSWSGPREDGESTVTISW